MRRKILIAVGALVGVVVVLLVGLLLYVKFGDLNRHRETVARMIGDAIGREIEIGGRLEPKIGFTTVIVAHDVSVANPEWAVEPAMVHADRLSLTANLLSLFSDTIRIHDIEITGARVALEVDADGRASWDFEGSDSGDDAGEPLLLEIAHARVDGLVFSYRDDGNGDPIEIDLDHAEIWTDETGMLVIDLDGRIREAALQLNGRISSLNDLIAAGFVEHDLTGSLGEIEIATRGSIENLAELTGVDLTLDASGPSLDATGTLAGVEGLPDEPFNVSGRVLWSGFPCSFENAEVRVGDNTLSLDGVLGEPPTLLGTDFSFDAAGPDVSALAALAGVDLPAESFDVSGRLVRREKGIGVEDVNARLGQTEVRVAGFVGDPPAYDGTDLELRAETPDLSVFRDLAGFDLPRQSFEIQGRLGHSGPAISLESVRARLGKNRMSVDGTLDLGSGFAGTDVQVAANGPSLAAVAALAAIDGVPSEPFDVTGGVRVRRKGYELREVKARLGDIALNAHGRVGPLPEIAGTDLDIRVEGPDLSYIGTLASVPDLPAVPFSVVGGAAVLETGYELRGVDATIGDLAVKANGRLGPPPGLEGTSLTAEARLPKLSAIGPYIDRVLPDEPFAARGSVMIEQETYRLDDVTIELGKHRLGARGVLVPSDDLVGSDLELEIAIPDLSELARFVSEAGLSDTLDVPAERASFSGRVSVHEGGYRLHDVEVGIRTGVANLDGIVGLPPDFIGSDLTVEARGPDGALLGAFTDFEVPPMPLAVGGRVERLENGVRFHDVALRYGESRVEVHGTLGELPKLIGTDLDLHAEGPSLEFLGNLAGKPDLPDLSFEVSGRFEGTPTQFSVPRLEVRLGPNDLRGALSADLQEKPQVRGRITSRFLDLATGFDERVDTAIEEQAETPETKKKKSKKKDAMVISDEPFDLDVLDEVDIDLRWTIDELILPGSRLSDFDLGILLEDRSLTLDPIDASVESGGAVAGILMLEPVGDRFRARARLSVDEYRLNLTTTESDPSTWTPIDIDLELDAEGLSPHGLASTLSGKLLVNIGEGRLDNSLINLVVADILVTLLDTLNPFRKEEPFTRLECGVISVNFVDGVAQLKPVVLRTSKMTVTGGGKVEFETEKFSLNWVTKPRKGIGLSASTITNSYIKLGGTLASPSIELKPLEAVTTTGVAVATAGLSVLGKGLWDRISAEQNHCERAVKKMEKRARKEQKKAESQ